MSVTELAIGIVDDFHDWIDGDDWVTAHEHSMEVPYRPVIEVTFASGKRFRLTVEEISG